MSYTVDRRGFGSRITTQDELDSSLNVVNFKRSDSTTSYECTYGYRTGEKSGSNKPDARDVYNPPKGASLHEILEYRKNFIERSVTKLAMDRSTSAPTHFILSDMGNEFSNTKLSVIAPENEILWRNPTRYRIRNGFPEGTFWINSDGSTSKEQPFSDFGSFLSGKGITEFQGGGAHGLDQASVNVIAANAISAMNPVQVHASVLTSLLELVKGDVPGILTRLRKNIDLVQSLRQKHSVKGTIQAGSSLGSAYLENVFGWAPIIRDVQAAVQVLVTLDGLLFPPDNTRRNFSRVIHSQYAAFDGSVIWSGINPILAPLGGTRRALVLNSPQSGASTNHGLSLPVTYTARETLDVRVTARFNTSLVPNAASNGHLDRMQELLGLRLTPEVLWDLTPWSWMVDWFANIGSVVGNISNLHMSNVILNYAYATFRREAVSGAWCRPSKSGSTTSGVQSFSGQFLTEYHLSQKVRFKASPYGFGSTLASLSQGQWAVLVALGLARAR